MAEPERNLAPPWVTTAGFGVLTLNSILAIYRAKSDPASVLFVSGSYAALVLLFRCLRTYERAPPGSPARERAKRAVWPLTLAFGAMACDSALAVHDARGDQVSAAAVLLAYAALLALTFRFLVAFAGRARGVEQGQDQGRGVAL